MLNLLSIGDPIIDTHVQIAASNNACRLLDQQAEQKLCFDYGAKIPIVDSFQELGGNAPNVAVATVKLGLSAALVSTIGDDANGKMIIEKLKHYKVDTGSITLEAGATTRYSIVLNYCGERTILSYSEKKNYIWPEPIPRAQWIYYTGLSEGYETVQKKLIEYLAAHKDTKLAINPGSYMLKYALPDLIKIIKQANVLIVNLEEGRHILGEAGMNEKNCATIVRNLCKLGVTEVALTDAHNGAWAGGQKEVWHVDAFPVEVVSKTGAGDAFSAAYLAARHYDLAPSEALLWGTANSSGVVRAHGPHAGLMTKEAILKTIEQFKAIQPVVVG